MLRNFPLALIAVALAVSGCRSLHTAPPGPQLMMPDTMDTTPRELDKAILPTYRVEPPDILVIEALHLVPKPPYKLRTSDLVLIQVDGTLPDAPIGGTFVIEPGGVVNLGQQYGSVSVAGLTVDEARDEVTKHLSAILTNPLVSVSLVQMAGMQQVAGQHLVGPDGTVRLGSYGSVSVVGMTLEQAAEAIEEHLSSELEDPQVSVDVFAYNSKVYYIITEGAGLGDQVYRFPITGNETVLDAISNINGTTQVSSKRIWIARPTRNPDQVQVLPVDWKSITAHGAIETNYQLLPGDRLFVAEDKLVALDTGLGKLLAPAERIFGFATFGASVVSRFSGPVLQGGGARNAGIGAVGGF